MSKRRFPLNKFPKLLKNPPPDVDIMLYDKKKEESNSGGNVMNNSNDGKMTLAKLAKIVSDGFKQVNTRIDRVESRIDNLEKDINARLDYIVDANNLKDNK